MYHYNQPKAGSESCLIMINAERAQICEKLNKYCYDAIALNGGHEEDARKIYNKMLAMIDVATMLDILTNEEHDFMYEKVHQFFCGIQIQLFSLPEITTHHFEKYGVLDLVLVYKINFQERMNDNLQYYRSYNTMKEQLTDDKDNFLKAIESMAEFAKEFVILKEEDLKKVQDVVAQHRRNKIKDTKIIFVPETFYTKELN